MVGAELEIGGRDRGGNMAQTGGGQSIEAESAEVVT
jgi:hypothetical protein